MNVTQRQMSDAIGEAVYAYIAEHPVTIQPMFEVGTQKAVERWLVANMESIVTQWLDANADKIIDGISSASKPSKP